MTIKEIILIITGILLLIVFIMLLTFVFISNNQKRKSITYKNKSTNTIKKIKK